MKTVIHLRSTFDAGGTENLIVRLLKEGSSRFRIILILMKPGLLMDKLDEEGIEIIHLYRRNKFDVGFIIRLLSAVKMEKPSIIHTHQLIELLHSLIIKSFFPSIRLFHHIHLFNPANSLFFRLERIICKYFVTRIFTVSNSLLSYQLEHGYPGSKTVVLYNIVEITNNCTIADKIKFKKLIHYSDSDYLIGMIGNFVLEKDQLTLAKAFRNILHFANCKLVFIGKEGLLSEKCKEIFKENELNSRVFFTGQLANASEYIPLFDLMVFSSKSETFGMAAVETLLYEVPLIASNIPAMQELSNNGQYFDLFPTGDHIALTEIISKRIYAARDQDRARLAYEYAKKHFSARAFVEQLENAYEF